MTPSTSPVNLSFSCPKQWKEMTPDKDGRFCSHCSKVVIDFSKTPLHHLDEQISAKQGKVCGSFHAHQLHKPFNNWKDVIISHYQKRKLEVSNHVIYRRAWLWMLTLLLMITGCTRTIVGMIAPKRTYLTPRFLPGTSTATIPADSLNTEK